MATLTTENVLDRFYYIHGYNKYDYSRFEYYGMKIKSCIICPKHGGFWQRPDNHLQGKGCPRCSSPMRIRKTLVKKFKNIVQPVDYKIIPLSKTRFTKVDNDDFDRLKDINWNYNGTGYAYNSLLGLMHRFILNTPKDKHTDHINRDRLDNRRINLRVATQQENSFNSTPHGITSKYKGVSWNKNRGKWIAQIKYDGKDRNLGGYNTEEEAANVYDKYAKQYYGEFALLNSVYLKERLEESK